MFERFTQLSRLVLVNAQVECQRVGSPTLEVEHLLIGLVESEGVVRQLFDRAGVDAAEVQATFVGPPRPDGAVIPSPAFSKEAKKVLELSLREALQLGSNYIGTVHVLLAITRARPDIEGYLRERGISRPDIVLALAGDEEGGPSGPGHEARSVADVLGGVVRRRLRRTSTGDDSGQELIDLAANEGTTAHRALVDLGVDLEALRRAVERATAASTAAEGRVALRLGDALTLTVEPGAKAAELRSLLAPLLANGELVHATTSDETLDVLAPDLEATIWPSLTAWVRAVGETPT